MVLTSVPISAYCNSNDLTRNYTLEPLTACQTLQNQACDSSLCLVTDLFISDHFRTIKHCKEQKKQPSILAKRVTDMPVHRVHSTLCRDIGFKKRLHSTVKPSVVICPTKDCHLVKMKNSIVNIKLKRYLKQMYLPVTVA